ncbi:hypothetical protein VIGAN_01526700, partial [Vigna angularis var. angularis]
FFTPKSLISYPPKPCLHALFSTFIRVSSLCRFLLHLHLSSSSSLAFASQLLHLQPSRLDFFIFIHFVTSQSLIFLCFFFSNL